MKIVFEDFFHIVFEAHFEFEGTSTPVRFTKNKFTGEVKISADDTARVLGYENIHDLLGSDHGLDTISEWLKDNPNKQVFGKHGSGALVEESEFKRKLF